MDTKAMRRTAVALAASAAIMFSMLLAATAIPRELIRRNALASGEHLMSLTDSTFWDIFPGFYPSREDKYADSILLGIAWQYDEHDVLGSVLSSRYYTNEKDITASLVSAVREDIPANMEYLRYWHGSLALVRPLLVFMPVQAIYAIDAVVMAVLSVWLAIRLAMRRAWGPLAGFLLALLSVSAWFVPLSLEYTWVFLIMLVEMHIILWKRFDDGWLPAFFAVSGAIGEGGKRKNNQAPKYVHGFQLFDKVRCGKDECFVFARRVRGYFSVRLVDGTVVSSGVPCKRLNLLEKRKTILVERRSAAPPHA